MKRETTIPSVNRRQFLTGLAAVGVGMSLASCGGNGGSGGASDAKAPVPLLTTETDPRAQKALKQTLSEFSSKNPKWEVKLAQAGTSSDRGEEIIRKLQTSQEVGIFELQDEFRLDWAKAGYLEPLDDVLDELGQDYYIDGSTFSSDGHVYGLPTQINPMMTWIRTDVLKQTGLSTPQNIDDLIEFAAAANSKQMFGTAFALGQTACTTAQFFPMVAQQGADYFDPQGNLTFDDPRVLVAVEKYAELMKYSPPGVSSWGYTEQQQAPLAGNVAIGRASGQYCANLVDDTKFSGVMEVLPKDVLGGPLAGQTQWGRWTQMGISSNTKNKAAAKAFLKYFLSDERLKRWVTVMPGKVSPVQQVNSDILSDKNSEIIQKYGRFMAPYYNNAPNAITPGSNMGSVVNGVFKKTDLLCPWAAQLWGATAPDITMLQEVVLRHVAPKEAWQKASQEIGSIAQQWKSQNPSWKPAA